MKKGSSVSESGSTRLAVNRSLSQEIRQHAHEDSQLGKPIHARAKSTVAPVTCSHGSANASSVLQTQHSSFCDTEAESSAAALHPPEAIQTQTTEHMLHDAWLKPTLCWLGTLMWSRLAFPWPKHQAQRSGAYDPVVRHILNCQTRTRQSGVAPHVQRRSWARDR